MQGHTGSPIELTFLRSVAAPGDSQGYQRVNVRMIVRMVTPKVNLQAQASSEVRVAKRSCLRMGRFRGARGSARHHGDGIGALITSSFGSCDFMALAGLSLARGVVRGHSGC